MTWQYMLDTDSVSYALRGHGQVAARILQHRPSGVAPVPFDADAAAHFGRLAALLAARGTPIGSFDALIAAHAITQKVILVTNNAKHFGRVTGLRCENWV